MHAHLVYQNPQNRKKIALKRAFLIEKMSIAEERAREKDEESNFDDEKSAK